MKETLLLWGLSLSVVATLLAVACSSETDPSKKGSITIICKPGDMIQFGCWGPGTRLGDKATFSDKIRSSNSYSLDTGKWRVAAWTMVKNNPYERFREWEFHLQAGRVETCDLYKKLAR